MLLIRPNFMEVFVYLCILIVLATEKRILGHLAIKNAGSNITDRREVGT